MASLTAEIIQARKALGLKENKIPTAISKQKNLLAHLQEKLERKQRAEQKRRDSGEREPAPKLLDEPVNRKEFVRQVREYRDMGECDLRSAIQAISEELFVRQPSPQTYMLWEAQAIAEEKEGVKLPLDTVSAQQKETTSMPPPPANTAERLKELALEERAAFVEMVWEHAHTAQVALSDAAKHVAEKLGVLPPPVHSLQNWRTKYAVPTRTLRRGAPIVQPPTSATINTTVPETVSCSLTLVLQYIAESGDTALDNMTTAINARKEHLRNEREQARMREVARIDEEIKQLQEKRKALLQ